MQINEKFLKPYDPKETEDRIYKLWEESGFFQPENLPAVQKDPSGPRLRQAGIERTPVPGQSSVRGTAQKDAETFSIVLPPPNVTGVLHMGHSAMLAIEDIMVRYNRMRGKKTLWLPGTDHAAIATQARVERELQKEGLHRQDLGREKFLERVDKFVEENKSTILKQIRKMGSSVDWSRYAFTLDEKRSLAVKTAFKRMYDAGLIYRGYRIVNWDPKGQTVISDDEVDHVERKGKLYTFRYSKDFPFPIATTRPETKVGDTAVAVHPDDERYKEYVGKTYHVHFAGVELEIRVVADEAVDPEFGTGAVGITPAHSTADWEIAQRHNLPVLKVINEYGRMEVDAPLLKDKKILEARETILEWLKDEGLFLKEEDIEQSIAVAQRSGGTIEPLPKLQWFIDVNKKFSIPHSEIKGIKSGQEVTLKELMAHVVKSDQIRIIPERFKKTYFHWIRNLRDWCISRQIWYGHRIPVWYKDKEIYVGVEPPKDADKWEQDPDTLDTWFSSGLWTFSTLGWPKDTEDLKNYHPTSVLETGYDILFFWVARMILMSTFHLGQIPFKIIYLHGLVRDMKGKKMSKSEGNVIDPLDMIEKYGADATRLSLVIGTGPGNDIRLSEDKIRGYKHYANKIWNASRFVLENLPEDFDPQEKPKLTKQNQKNIKELENIVKEITKDIEEYKFYLAGEKLYHWFWHTFADVIIEESKIRLKPSQTGAEEKRSAQWTLYTILITLLKMLHPFMPFVTEEIWQSLPQNKRTKEQKNKKTLLMIEKWPM